jgi:hypothetical protein
MYEERQRGRGGGGAEIMAKWQGFVTTAARRTQVLPESPASMIMRMTK